MKRIFYLIFTILVGIGCNAGTMNDKENGREIMRRALESYDGFLHVTGDLEMILVNKAGKRKTRIMEVFAHEQEDDGDRTILLFKRPRDVQGTALLTHTHYNGINDQWIYLPAFKRTKRIADKSKTSPFMGSEFSYEDLASMELPMYDYQFIKDEQLGTVPCHLIALSPTYPNSAYSRFEVWVNQQEVRIEQIKFYDKNDKHLKTLTSRDYKKYKEKFWHPNTLTMVNHVNGKSTDLIIKNLDYQRPLPDQMFTTGSLRSLDR